MRAKQFTTEASLGTTPKRPARAGSRPERGHEPMPQWKKDWYAKQKPNSWPKHPQPYHNPNWIDELPPGELDKLKGKKEIDEGKTVKQETPKPRNFVAKNAIQSGAGAHKDKKKAQKQGDVKHKSKALELAEMEAAFDEAKASRQLCKSATPDEDLGASQLASCKSQGLRARDGEKSHKLGKSPKSRVTVGGHRIKGRKYGGPLPDWS